MKKSIFTLTLIVSGLLAMGAVAAKNDKAQAASLKEVQMHLEKAQEKIKDPKVDQEIEVIKNESSESGELVDQSLQKMASRSAVIKLIAGPDYKNAGQVRSEIMHLENQVRQLTRIEAKLPAAEQPAMQTAIASLRGELTAIQFRLATALQGFSLFGWVSRFLSGYTLPVTVTPTP